MNRSLRIINRFVHITNRCRLHSSQLNPATIRVAVVLERYPSVEPPLDPFVTKFKQFSREIQIEKSALSFEEYLDIMREQEKSEKSSKKKGGKSKQNSGNGTHAGSSSDDSRAESPASNFQYVRY